MSTFRDRLDGLQNSVAIKPPCVVATSANITLSGEQTINGVAVVSGDRVLVRSQTNGIDNGIWTAATGAWSRALDFNGSRDCVQGTLVSVLRSGQSSAFYQLTTADPVIGTSSLTFASAVIPGLSGVTIASLAETTGMTDGTSALVSEDDRSGLFVFDDSDLSAEVTLDTYQGVYVAPDSDDTGESGAWVRQYDGEAEFSWFGIVAGGTSNAAARAQSAINLLSDTTTGAAIRLPQGRVVFDGRITIPNGVVIRGHGNTAENPGTVCEFPAGSSGFFCDYESGVNDSFDTKITDLRIYQPTDLETTATGNYVAATRTFTFTGGTNDYEDGQVVWIEGVGYSYAVQGRTYASTSGSPTLTITSLGGNPGVHPGQHISGTGIPAGATVVSMTSTEIVISANATSTGSGRTYTVIYPMIARIISGGGTSAIVLDHVLDHSNATGVVIRHADAAIDSMRPIQLENVDTIGFPVGVFLGADSSGVPVSITNTSQIRFCRLSSEWASLVFTGSDANACGTYGCDFSFSDHYGILDLSLIGNKHFGAHFAFGIGIANPRSSSTTAIFGGYFESGTSYLGNGNGATAFGCDGVNNGNGFATVAINGGGFFLPSVEIEGTAGAFTVAEGYFEEGILQTGTAGIRAEGTNGSFLTGVAGIGVELFKDGTNGYVAAYNRTSSAYVPLALSGSAVKVNADAGNLSATFDSTGLNLVSGDAYHINGVKCLSGKGAAVTDVSTTGGDADVVAAQLNALMAQLRTISVLST